MKAVVTGAAGFIGSAVCLELLDKGYEVFGIDNYSSGGAIPKGCHPLAEDVSKEETWNSPYLPYAPDEVYHFAASFANQRSMDYPLQDAQWNILGTLLAAQYASRNKARLIYTGSSSSYGAADVEGDNAIPFKETAFPAPSTPYAVSKWVGEFYAKMMTQDAIVLRLFNVFGPGDPPGLYRNAIPNMAASAVKNRKVPVYGKDATRDFMFIDDAVLAITTAAARINDFTVCNLCTGYETKMHYIAELIACRYGAEVQLHEPRDWDTVSRRSGDPAKMVSIWPELELGRRIGFVGRLEKTLDWLEQEHFKGGRRDLVREDAVYRSAHG